jgi:hypothetical protein
MQHMCMCVGVAVRKFNNEEKYAQDKIVLKRACSHTHIIIINDFLLSDVFRDIFPMLHALSLFGEQRERRKLNLLPERAM